MKGQLRNSVSVAAIAIAAGLLSTPPAGAADYTPPFTPQLVFSWHGVYTGVHIGGGEADFDGIFKGATVPSNSNVYYSALDVGGFAGGFHVGYNWDNGGPVVWGLEGDLTFTNWDDSVAAVSSSESGTGSVDMLGSIRGRIGIPLTDSRRALVYFTGGVAWIDADGTATDGPPPGATTQSISLDDVGGVIGGGFEWAWTENVRLRGEGLYYFFDDSGPLTLAEADPGDFIAIDDAWVARFGVSWYFQ